MNDHDPEPTRWTQLTLLEEPAAHLAVRCVLLRGDLLATVSYTVTRDDGTWLACEVRTCRSGPEAIAAELAEMTKQGLDTTLELIGPF